MRCPSLRLHELDLPELYRELGETLCRLERYDESLEAWEAAIAAGIAGCSTRGRPWPRCCCGPADEKRPTFSSPTSVTSAPTRSGCTTRPGSPTPWSVEHAAALPWLEEGIAMSLADGDREGIVHQLDEERTRCREALGLCDDELTAQVAAFERPDRRPGASIDEPKTEPRFAAPSPSFPTLRCARQVDRSASVAEKRTPEMPDGMGVRPGRGCELGYCWFACHLVPDVGRTGAHVRPRGGGAGGW